MNLSVILLIGAVIIVGAGAYLFSQPQASVAPSVDEQAMEKDDAMMEADAMMEKDADAMMEADTEAMMMQKSGSYEAYTPEKIAKADEQDVVLFFRASWCPTCRALDADLEANRDAIPSNLVVLDVNYDTEAALKQKYGVTYQHTMVQVDAEGNLIKKWTGSTNLSQLTAEVI